MAALHTGSELGCVPWNIPIDISEFYFIGRENGCCLTCIAMSACKIKHRAQSRKCSPRRHEDVNWIPITYVTIR